MIRTIALEILCSHRCLDRKITCRSKQQRRLLEVEKHHQKAQECPDEENGKRCEFYQVKHGKASRNQPVAC